jgi:CrcB protein
MMDYLYVGLGGLVGSIARYWVGGWAAERFGIGFPYGTFLINVSGSFVLGLVIAYLGLRTASPSWRLFLAVGFCGGYTTFSTYTYETLKLLEEGSVLLAFLYFVGGPLLGLGAVAVGMALGRVI